MDGSAPLEVLDLSLSGNGGAVSNHYLETNPQSHSSQDFPDVAPVTILENTVGSTTMSVNINQIRIGYGFVLNNAGFYVKKSSDDSLLMNPTRLLTQ